MACPERKHWSANAAAIKAFVVNRVGDFGFALGIFLIFYTFGTVNYSEVFQQIPQIVDKELLNMASKLKVIGRAGVGVDNVDIDTATANKILVMNTPLGNLRNPCEKHCISTQKKMNNRFQTTSNL